jgi:acyl carrier protein
MNMTRNTFLDVFADCLQEKSSPITGEEVLESLTGWDSLAVVVMIAQLDRAYGIILSPSEIRHARTVNDLYAIADNMKTVPHV